MAVDSNSATHFYHAFYYIILLIYVQDYFTRTFVRPPIIFICLFVQSCTSSEEQEELDDSAVSIEDVTSADYDVESTDSEQELQMKRHIQLAEFVGEYEDDVELMQQMGLPLSFFNSPYDKTDKVLE